MKKKIKTRVVIGKHYNLETDSGLPVIKYQTFEECIASANDSEFGLATIRLTNGKNKIVTSHTSGVWRNLYELV